MPAIGTTAVLDATKAAVQHILRPLATAMIRAGMTFPMFNKLAREAFVEAAAEDFPVDGDPPNQSRIAILSGVHRKEIRRLFEQDRSIPEPPPTLPLSAKVIAVWTSASEYLDAGGKPRPLPRSCSDDTPSFEKLVRSVSKDIRPRSLLDEWVRQEIAEIHDDMVHLVRPAFLPAGGYDEKAYFFGRNVRDHVAAGAHNLAGDGQPLFDRAVYYDRLKQESIEELRILAAEKSMKLLIEINKKAGELASRDRKDGDGGYRFTLGAFFFASKTRPRDDND